jgi:hypothetical protein
MHEHDRTCFRKRPFDLVAIGLIRPSWTSFSFAIGLDVASQKMCGIGVHEDPDLARVHAIFDSVRDNGWCAIYGRPKAIVTYCERSLEADRMAAALSGSKLQYGVGDGAELIRLVANSLAQHLEHVSERGHSFEYLYSETVSWAIHYNAPAVDDPALPVWTWEVGERVGDPPAIVKGLELPTFSFGTLHPGGRIECEGTEFEHPWLDTFRQQALPYNLAFPVCRFPGNNDRLWLIDDHGCFEAVRVDPRA